MSAADRERFTAATKLDAIEPTAAAMLESDALGDALLAAAIASELIRAIRATEPRCATLDAFAKIRRDRVELLRAIDRALESSIANGALDDRALSTIRAAIIATAIDLDEGIER